MVLELEKQLMQSDHSRLDQGASKNAIQSHYDVGNEFFGLFLDPEMVYSCALYAGDDDTLEAAQQRKLDFHLDAAGVGPGSTVLDVGCGWGALLRRAVAERGCRHAHGLTLSQAQVDQIRGLGEPRIQVSLASWADFCPEEPFDGLISIGAMEHFVRPEASDEERVATYRSFFEWCRSVTRLGAQISLQTMAYDRASYRADSPVSNVFPESDLPRLHQLIRASDGVLGLESVVNHPEHYARTSEAWLGRLNERFAEATRAVGEDVVRTYQHFLAGGTKGYRVGAFQLLRIRFVNRGG